MGLPSPTRGLRLRWPLEFQHLRRAADRRQAPSNPARRRDRRVRMPRPRRGTPRRIQQPDRCRLPLLGLSLPRSLDGAARSHLGAPQVGHGFPPRCRTSDAVALRVRAPRQEGRPESRHLIPPRPRYRGPLAAARPVNGAERRGGLPAPRCADSPRPAARLTYAGPRRPVARRAARRRLERARDPQGGRVTQSDVHLTQSSSACSTRIPAAAFEAAFERPDTPAGHSAR